jgi:hypothetical protein
VYEGGLRVWEGSLDLVRYLDAHKDTVLFVPSQQPNKKGGKNKKGDKGGGRGGKKGGGGGGSGRSEGSKGPLRCLDLGCGHGLPGLFALRAKGARWRVCFSDFHAEVFPCGGGGAPPPAPHTHTMSFTRYSHPLLAKGSCSSYSVFFSIVVLFPIFMCRCWRP